MGRWRWLRIGPPEVPSLDWVVISAVLAATALAMLRAGPPGA